MSFGSVGEVLKEMSNQAVEDYCGLLWWERLLGNGQGLTSTSSAPTA